MSNAIFDPTIHRGMYAPTTVIADGEVLWWDAIFFRVMMAMGFINGAITISGGAAPATTMLWFQAHPTNAGLGTISHYNGASWVALTPGELFTHLRNAAGYNPTAPATNLSIAAQTATTLDIDSSTGAAATVPAATTALAGLMTAADKTKLNSLSASGAATAGPVKAPGVGSTISLNAGLADFPACSNVNVVNYTDGTWDFSTSTRIASAGGVGGLTNGGGASGSSSSAVAGTFQSMSGSGAVQSVWQRIA